MRLVHPLTRPRTLTAAAAVAVLLGGALHPTIPAHAAQHRSTATRTIVVRPVTASGTPSPDWTVKRERDLSVTCDEGTAPAAVDDDIRLCGPSAAYTPACWKSRDHTVLCLRDARSHVLVRIRYTGAFAPVTARSQPSPQALRLGEGGQTCEIRVGGAWGQIPSHRRWVGFYSCTKSSVYGPPPGDGVDRANPTWTVHVWRHGTTVNTKDVRTAWLVGTAT